MIIRSRLDHATPEPLCPRPKVDDVLHVLQINAVSMAPITAVQFGANRLYEQALENLSGRRHASS